MTPIDVFTLTDGGQSAEDVAHRLAQFLNPTKATLELALYDVRLPDPTGAIVADELRAASSRGVVARPPYTVDSGSPSELLPPPRTPPDILAEPPIDGPLVPGITDLMHHKY